MSFLSLLPLIVLALCFILRVPISFSLIGTGVIYVLMEGNDVGIIPNIVMGALESNTVIVAIPLFIFTANIMNSCKVTEHMFTFTKALVGKKRGAMAYINIVISLIFSGMSGAALADVAGIGTLELEEMKKDGYDMPFSSALTSATAVVGPIFPPSIPLIVYGMLAEVSVGMLFMGGMIPAVLICVSLGIYVWYISKKRNYPSGVKFTFRQFAKYTLKALPALLTPVILLGGMYSGIVTPTEAGALAALYTILISVFAYRTLRFKGFLRVVKETVIQTGTIIAIIMGTYVMSYVITTSGIGDIIADWFLGITQNKYVFLLIANILFLILGMLFDFGIMMYIFIPLFLPIVIALGINLVHFGVVMVVNMMLGGATPPYGVLCFLTAGMTKTPLQKVFREVIPMDLVMIGVLLLITYIPELVMFIPNLLL